MKKILVFLSVILISKVGFAQWIQKNNFPLTNGGASSFSTGDTGIIVAGAGSGIYNNTWLYDTLTDSWATGQNYPGVAGGVKVGFSINGMGYVGTGTSSGFNWYTEFYQYNPGTNVWTPKANFMGIERGYAVGFSLLGKGYIGCGVGGGFPGTNFHAFKDFYCYDPSNDTWTRIADYPGKGSQLDVSFVIGDKAYVGCGQTEDSSTWTTTATDSDFWQYDPSNNTWTRIANFAGGPRAQATSYSTCDRGYVGLGYSDLGGNVNMNDFWQYDPSNNTWTQMGNFTGGARSGASAFVIGKSVFAGVGGNLQDWWEMHLSLTPGVTTLGSSSTSICAGQTVSFSDTSNFNPTNWYWQFPGGKPDTSTQKNPIVEYDTVGTYNVILAAWNSCDSGSQTITNYITVTPYSSTISITPDSPSVCVGQTLTLMANGGAGAIYQWVGTGDTTDSIKINPTKDTTYELVVGSGNCSKDTIISVKVNKPSVLIINPMSPVEECSGQGVILIADSTGSNYMWTPSTGLGATTGSAVLANPTADITYTITGLDSLGCSVSATEVLIVNKGPNKPTITISVTGDTLISSATNGNQWYLNGQPVSGATDSIYVITGLPKGDTIRVSVTNVANGCSTTSDSLILSGINQLSIVSNQLSIYPNPTNGTINVNISTSVGELKNWNLQLTDVLGRTLYVSLSLNYNNEIDLSKLPANVYFITIINKMGRIVYPIVKQNY